ncbi:KAP family NTPase [Wolbachia endosymbiont of Howardula sp.]|uniref:KAP family NTPase n=1 Tax=Wolbachia endosymbiont of Howardula sp. TaxID=2916816 RepID=UPI00217E08E3|nr:KAP family NTPase [Wolbachia endosymbiont of Howardula sp.]UWI83362.1 KAP family NTPase [Wolbachia endosymbiont of Howardula sp.]
MQIIQYILRKITILLKFKKQEKYLQLTKLIPWQNDYLGYRNLSKKFNNITLMNRSDFKIILLEGYEGWGKTFFLKEWVQDFKQKNIIASYYNAWTINALDQPLPSLLNFLFQDLFISYKVKSDMIRKFKKIHHGIFSFNTLEKLLRKSPLTILTLLLDSIKETDNKDIDFVLKELSILQKRVANVKDFTIQLGKIVNSIRRNHNIYIMVDNLDICRPKFIVDFLESIKYILNIEGLVFIVTVNKDQSNVYRAIHSILGSHYDPKAFFDFSLNLPKSSIVILTQELFRSIKLPVHAQYLIIDSFILYAESFLLSPKIIAYCIKRVEFYLINYVLTELPAATLFTFLVILEVINMNIYEELSHAYPVALDKIIKEFKDQIIKHKSGQKEWEILIIYLHNAFSHDQTSEMTEDVKQVKKILF